MKMNHIEFRRQSINCEKKKNKTKCSLNLNSTVCYGGTDRRLLKHFNNNNKSANQ